MNYKVIEKAISLQLKSMLADMIHPDQTCTVPTQTIFDNRCHLMCRDGLSLIRLSADRRRHLIGCMMGILQALGFRPCFVGFFQLLYVSVECLVKLNWALTELVTFGQVVCHGCSLSIQLHAIATEPFLCLLGNRMMGLFLWEPDLQMVLLAYADSMLLMVQEPASSTWVSWVKDSGLMVGDGLKAGSLPFAVCAVLWGAVPLLCLARTFMPPISSH